MAPELPNPRENSHGVRAVPRSTTANILAGYSAVLGAERGGSGRSRQARRGVWHRTEERSNEPTTESTPRQQESAFRADFFVEPARNLERTHTRSGAGLARARSGGRRPSPSPHRARCSARRFSRRALSRRASTISRRASRFSSPKAASSPRETGWLPPAPPRSARSTGRATRSRFRRFPG